MPAALTTVTRRGYTLREEPVDGGQAAKELGLSRNQLYDLAVDS